MTGEDFRKFVFRSPFRAVRITLESGESFLVRHPEQIGVAGGMALVVTNEGFDFFELPRVVSVRQLRNGR
ncbi:MAG: hypothetical protein HYY17_14305 [Planctomycetes bacterium]|nr:hypothetical protein [Planctomycetota bacterium]